MGFCKSIKENSIPPCQACPLARVDMENSSNLI